MLYKVTRPNVALFQRLNQFLNPEKFLYLGWKPGNKDP